MDCLRGWEGIFGPTLIIIHCYLVIKLPQSQGAWLKAMLRKQFLCFSSDPGQDRSNKCTTLIAKALHKH